MNFYKLNIKSRSPHKDTDITIFTDKHEINSQKSEKLIKFQVYEQQRQLENLDIFHNAGSDA